MRNIKKIATVAAMVCMTAFSAMSASAEWSFNSTEGGKYTWSNIGESQIQGTVSQEKIDGMITYSVANNKNDYIYRTGNYASLVWWNGDNADFSTAGNGRELTFKPTYDGTVTVSFKSAVAKGQKAPLMLWDGKKDIELGSSENSAVVECKFEVTAGNEYKLHPANFGVAITAFSFTAPSKAVTYGADPERITDENEPDAVAFYGEVCSKGDAAKIGFTVTAEMNDNTSITSSWSFGDEGTPKITGEGKIVFGLIIDALSEAGIASPENVKAEYYTGE